ncbi:MAG: saccharopine dehydrogenase [Myxococcota bacterium]
MSTHFWLRAESKPFERRCALPPKSARALLEAGFELTLEEDPDRVFGLDDYPDCPRVPAGSWRGAPKDAVILGLKELIGFDEDLTHRHIHFAHVYKEQHGWKEFMGRFDRGGGTLFDLEFLTQQNGRRVAAFGYWAGYVGAVLGMAHAQRLRDGGTLTLSPPYAWDSRASLEELLSDPPIASAIVVGARGRSGTGACDALEAAGVQKVTRWDKRDTVGGGPFDVILEHELFVNCVYLADPIPPFVGREQLARVRERALSVIADVSCDPTSPWNPIPLYDSITTVEAPTVRAFEAPPVDVMAIDHLPSLLPRESSEDFGEQLLPHLLAFDSDPDGVWSRAAEVFETKLAEARA